MCLRPPFLSVLLFQCLHVLLKLLSLAPCFYWWNSLHTWWIYWRPVWPTDTFPFCCTLLLCRIWKVNRIRWIFCFMQENSKSDPGSGDGRECVVCPGKRPKVLHYLLLGKNTNSQSSHYIKLDQIKFQKEKNLSFAAVMCSRFSWLNEQLVKYVENI